MYFKFFLTLGTSVALVFHVDLSILQRVSLVLHTSTYVLFCYAFSCLISMSNANISEVQYYLYCNPCHIKILFMLSIHPPS